MPTNNNAVLSIRLPKAELKKIKKAAKTAVIPTSLFVRHACRERIRRVTKKA